MNALEQQLRGAGAQPHLFVTPAADEPQVEATRAAENLALIHAELDSPRESRLARLLRRLRVPDLSVPLVTATPALRRSWFVSILIALLFALSATTNQTADGVDRIVVFLTLAPLLPLLGVALAFGKGVDPTHELVLAAPRDTFTIFLIRAMTVLGASSALLLLTSALLPEGGLYRVAWLLPALAVTTLTMVLSVGRDPRRVAAAVASSWILVVLIISPSISVGAMFGPVTQIVSLVVAVAAGWVLFGRRGRFDTATVDS